jgi:hypothetical protein
MIMHSTNKHAMVRLAGLSLVAVLVLAACSDTSARATTPMIDPTISNQAPKTRVLEPGQCKVILNAPAPAYTSSAIGVGQSSGGIPPGTYEVGVVVQYGTSLWYGLNDVGMASYISNTSVSSTTGDCAPGS